MVPAGSTPESAGGIGTGKWVSVGDAALRSSLASAQDGLGDALMTVEQPLPLAVARSQHDKNADVVSVKDFGAIGDGQLHPLSERFTSLDLAKIVYPFVTSLDQSIDWAATQAALDTGKDVYIPAGVYVCNAELEMITPGQRIYGAGRGYGYNGNNVRLSGSELVSRYSAAVFNNVRSSALLFKGTGIKRVRTRINHRASVSDAQDAAMSVCVNVQAEGTHHENYCILLDITLPAGGAAGELTDSIDNLGANWDVGLFISSRCNTSLKSIAVVGYHRMANIWFDVTQAINLPRFNSYRSGLQLTQGPVENGADGCSLDGVFTSGGLWGLNVQGPKPKSGETTLVSPYYDQLLGTTTTDARGTWGFSDFLVINCQIFGANHHTRRRLVDMKASPDAKNDWDVGGAFSIDGVTLNVSNAVQGHRYISTRFQSWAPFTVRIDRSARDVFMGCMIENPSSVVKARDGSAITLSPATAFYGLCATDRHNLLTILESQAPISSTYTVLKYGDSQFANASQANPITRTPYNRFEVLSADETTTVAFRMGTIADPNKATISRSTLNSMVFTTDASFLFQNTAGTTLMQIAPSGNAISTGSVYPSTDNSKVLGTASQRWSQVYAATGTINTSDERVKTDVLAIPDKVLKAWGKVQFMQFRYSDAVEEKGEGAARIHFGLIAQRVKEAFESEGLDPFAYGLLCYDEWDNVYEPVMGIRTFEIEGETHEEEYDTGEKRLITAAGNRYGIRYEEALVLECAYLRSMLNH